MYLIHEKLLVEEAFLAREVTISPRNGFPTEKPDMIIAQSILRLAELQLLVE
jgi:hypothetical protein